MCRARDDKKSHCVPITDLSHVMCTMDLKYRESSSTEIEKKSIKSNPFVFAFQAYISCALGVHRVGYVMICFGVVNAGCSLLFGSLMKFVGRQPLMALGAIVHASLVVVLLMWKPHPENPYVFYSVSGLWGVGDAVWQTQVNGEYFLHYTCCQNRIIYY